MLVATGAAPLGLAQEPTAKTEKPAAVAAPAAGSCVAREKGEHEEAVGHALRWLSKHQLKSGAWSFDHGLAPQHVGPVNHRGAHRSQVGSTGLVLLCFFGAGQLHTEGMYRREVDDGLQFLRSAMENAPGEPSDGDFRGEHGGMMDHAIATMALCEAYALSQDKTLEMRTQRAVAFLNQRIVADKLGVDGPGGTRPELWLAAGQIAALRSAYMAQFKVDPQRAAEAHALLDGLQSDGGAAYGWAAGETSFSASSIALTTRVLGLGSRGWRPKDPRMLEGTARLLKAGFQKDDPCGDLAAAMLMRSRRKDEWVRWNAVARDALVESQKTEGCWEEEFGSWTPTDRGAFTTAAGRLGWTAVCTLTLEVYYRHLPLFKEATYEIPFGLED